MFNLSQMSNYFQVRIQSHNFPYLFPTFAPVRKNSENASILSVDSTDSNITRSPPSMPVPTVPRRAGPPRKKSVKPPPEVLEVSEERTEEAIATPPVISTVDELEHKAIPSPEHKDVDHKDHREIHDEPQSIDSEPANTGILKEQELTHDAPLATIEASNEIKQEQDHEHEHEHQTEQAEDDEIIDSSDEHSDYDENQSVEHHDDRVGAEPQPFSVVDATGTKEEEEDAAEEEARRKRVAERLAKMGGINPFAAPLSSPPLPPSSEETGLADSPVVSSHASLRGDILPESPSRPDIPTRRASLSSHEVAKSHPLPVVESKVEEEQGEREISDGK
jgi:myosin tail region-interacting protein MTI1